MNLRDISIGLKNIDNKIISPTLQCLLNIEKLTKHFIAYYDEIKNKDKNNKNLSNSLLDIIYGIKVLILKIFILMILKKN